MNLLRSGILLAAMLFMSGAAYLLTPVAAAVRVPELLKHAIPHKFSRWQQEADHLIQVDVGVRDPGDATEDPRQAYDEVLMRTYRRDDGARVMLALAYGRLQRQEIKIHRPDLCYYGQGFDVRHLPDHQLPLTNLFTVNVQTMLAQKPRRTELVSYWIRIGDRVTSSAWQTRLALFKDGIHGVIPDGILVRVSSLITADEQMAAAREAQQDFLSSLYQALPAPEQRLIAGKGVSLLIQSTIAPLYGMASLRPAILPAATAPRTYGIGRNVLLFGLLTASFDLFLVLTVGGFTFRVHQILLPASALSALAVTYRNEKIRPPFAWYWLMLWTTCMVAFIPHTMYLPRSIGYAIWLLMDVGIIFVTVQLFGSLQWIELLLRRYLQVFIVASSIGLLQLLLGLAHVPDPFVKQWIVGGIWPRINGFSYEPSYFCTYLLMGWVFSGWLIEKQVYVLGRRLTRVTFGLTTVAMILSTSRLGWGMMLLWGVGYLWRHISFTRSPKFSPLLMTAGLCMAVVTTVFAISSPDKVAKHLVMFAAGTGLGGTAAHSVNDREKSLGNTITVFEKSPWLGYSLGGVATAIAVDHGTMVTGNTDAKRNEGGSVFVEVLAASGLFAMVPFLLYIASLIVRPARLGRRVGTEAGAIVSGLAWALLMELIILQFNQNILRAYLWFHIGVVSAAYAAVRAGAWNSASVSDTEVSSRRKPDLQVVPVMRARR